MPKMTPEEEKIKGDDAWGWSTFLALMSAFFAGLAGGWKIGMCVCAGLLAIILIISYHARGIDLSIKSYLRRCGIKPTDESTTDTRG